VVDGRARNTTYAATASAVAARNDLRNISARVVGTFGFVFLNGPRKG
jgi:hypothetical protein